jgi:small subunit ribosomal protein S6
VIDYEILLLLDPELPEEKQAETIARTRDLIEKGGGTVDRHDAWGRRKLAYEIDHKTDGSYHLLLFSASPETLDEVSRVLKIDDTVMRHMATRRYAGSPGQPIAVGASGSEDAGDETSSAFEEE